MLVRTNLIAIIDARVEDEVGVDRKTGSSRLIVMFRQLRGFKSQQESLNDMVCVRVNCHVKDSFVEFSRQIKNFSVAVEIVSAENLYESLHDACSVHIHSKIDC